MVILADIKNKVLGMLKVNTSMQKLMLLSLILLTTMLCTLQNAKGWMASVDYALQNNVGLSANYGFDWKTQNGNDKG